MGAEISNLGSVAGEMQRAASQGAALVFILPQPGRAATNRARSYGN
jgi:hypothetical protein